MRFIYVSCDNKILFLDFLRFSESFSPFWGNILGISIHSDRQTGPLLNHKKEKKYLDFLMFAMICRCSQFFKK